jgi:MEMO1 family protein
MRNIILFIVILIGPGVFAQNTPVRNQKDTVGFASKAWHMDSLMQRYARVYGDYYEGIDKDNGIDGKDVLRFAVCPHDDYTYAGFLYNEVFSHIKAKTVIILGVAHKAKKFGIEQKIVFDDFIRWHAAYKDMDISPLRQQLIAALPAEDYMVSDSLQTEEHSVEAFIPFLQYYNRNAEIISILVPHMPFSKMQTISRDLATAISSVMRSNHLKWGSDIALLVSTDAVHYGDEDWGGSNYAPFGSDSAGYAKAIEKEHAIMKDCFSVIDTFSAKRFMDYTVQGDDWHNYKWTWCGRYSVPFAMLTSYYLRQRTGAKRLINKISDYSTSIARKPMEVLDLNMGATAPASLHHWVGYCVEVYF